MSADAALRSMTLKHRWRQLLRFPGALTVGAFLLNEILLLVPPHLWMIPYFPLRAVGIPLLGFCEATALVIMAGLQRTAIAIRRALLGAIIVAGIIWISWHYNPAPLLELFDPLRPAYES